MKRLIAVLCCFVLILSVVGCKKDKPEPVDISGGKQSVSDNTVTQQATPTPIPVTAKELRTALNEQLSEFLLDKGTEVPLASLIENYQEMDGSNLSVKFPDGEFNAVLKFDFSLDLLGLMDTKLDIEGNGSFASKANLVEGRLDTKTTAEVVNLLKGDETNSNTEELTTEFYLDNTEDGVVTIYTRDSKENVWYREVESYADLFSSATSSIDSTIQQYTGESDSAENEKSDKRFDDFLDAHSVANTTVDGHTLATQFTWAEIYEFYKEEFDKTTDELMKSFSFFLSDDEDSVKNTFDSIFKNGTGEFDIVSTFDFDKKLKSVEFNIQNFKLLAEISDDQSGEPASLGVRINNGLFKLNANWDSTKSVEIPSDVLNGAVEHPSDTDWDTDYDWNTDYDYNWDTDYDWDADYNFDTDFDWDWDSNSEDGTAGTENDVEPANDGSTV